MAQSVISTRVRCLLAV